MIDRLKHLIPLALGLTIAAATAAIVWMLIDPPDFLVPSANQSEDRQFMVGQLPREHTQDGQAGKARIPPAVKKAAIVRPVSGRVLLPDGRPAVGARVQVQRNLAAWPHEKRETLQQDFTSKDGGFQLAVERERGLEIIATHPGYAVSRIEVFPDQESHVLQLHEGFQVRGHVLDSRRRPLPGCRVVLSPAAINWRAQWTDTNGQGMFRFQNVPAGMVHVEARHRNFRPVQKTVPVGVSESIYLQFAKVAVQVSGRVTRVVDGEPVADATVRAYPNVARYPLLEPQVAATDSLGRFTLEGLAPGNRLFEVHHPDQASTTRVVQVNEMPGALDFELDERFPVTGRLRGIPPGVGTIDLVLRTRLGELSRTRVAVDGAFKFPASFSPEGGEFVVEDGVVAFGNNGRSEIRVRVDEGRETVLDLDVIAPAELEGRVIDESGVGVEGVRVGVLQPFLRNPLQEIDTVAVTDSAGRFRILGQPEGATTLIFDSHRHARASQQAIVPAPGATQSIAEVVLVAGGSISGRVMRGAREVAGALVFVDWGRTGGVTAVSRQDGRYAMTHLAPGKYRVKARFSSLPVALSATMVKVESGKSIGPIDLSFPAGRPVEGRVLGGDDQGMEAWVTVGGMIGTETRTDEDGRFTVYVPKGKTVELWAYTMNLQEHTFRSIRPDQNRVTLQLATPPTGVVRGTFLELPERTPVGFALVRVEIAGADPEAMPSRSTWAARMPGGELELAGVPAGTLQIVVQCEGRAPFVHRHAVLAIGGTLDLGEVLLEPGNAVSGLVFDPQGNPVVGAQVFLGSLGDLKAFWMAGVMPQLTTDREGAFTVHGVTSASRSLIVRASGYAPREVELQLPRDVLRSTPMPLTLEKGAHLLVAVRDAAGRPFERGLVQLSREGMVLDVKPVDDEGLARFNDLGRGIFHVTLFGRMAQDVSVEISEPGKTYQVGLTSDR